MSQKRIAITGMSVNTPIGDNLQDFVENLLAGKSAISQWKMYDTQNIYSKVGADLNDYDINAKLEALAAKPLSRPRNVDMDAPMDGSPVSCRDAFTTTGTERQSRTKNVEATE